MPPVQLQTGLWVEEQRPLVGRIRHAVETWSEPWKLYAPLKPDTEAPFRFKDTLIISSLANRNTFLATCELTHLETANTPPFMEPKQDRATKTGTANEKFPSSRSEKVWWKTERSKLMLCQKAEENETTRAKLSLLLFYEPGDTCLVFEPFSSVWVRTTPETIIRIGYRGIACCKITGQGLNQHLLPTFKKAVIHLPNLHWLWQNSIIPVNGKSSFQKFSFWTQKSLCTIPSLHPGKLHFDSAAQIVHQEKWHILVSYSNLNVAI